MENKDFEDGEKIILDELDKFEKSFKNIDASVKKFFQNIKPEKTNDEKFNNLVKAFINISMIRGGLDSIAKYIDSGKEYFSVPFKKEEDNNAGNA